MAKILIVNGPNLNLLGKREPEVYGTATLDELNGRLKDMADELGMELVFFQSNAEGDLIDFIHKEAFEADGLIINPGALTHYSYALRDAIAAVDIETVEVHMSNIYKREQWRHKSVLADICQGHLVGFGFYGYAMALSYFADTTPETES
jgi:3-dehydroquinate dehydratase-2